MGRQPRRDEAGAWHHVMNRGIARRPTFEGRPDAEAFLEALGDVARTGRLEIHAFAAMTNHFHLLVRSPSGELSEGMRRLENAYVRGFNRVRGRDGSLFRGRFTSRRVTSDPYWHAVLRYIDRNPVSAGLVARAEDFPYGSAWWYARAEGPAWLTRTAVERAVRAFTGAEVYDPASYAAFTAGGDEAWERHVVEGRLKAPPAEEDPLADLVGAATPRIREWLRDRARLADGAAPGPVLAAPAALLRAIDGRVPRDSPASGSLRVGLLRAASGLTQEEIGSLWGKSRPWVRTRWTRHRRAMLSDPAYAEDAATVLREGLRGALGGRLIRDATRV